MEPADIVIDPPSGWRRSLYRIEPWFLLPAAITATVGMLCLGAFSVLLLTGMPSLTPERQAHIQEVLKSGPPYPWMFGTALLLRFFASVVYAAFAMTTVATAILWARMPQIREEVSGRLRPGWVRILVRIAAWLSALPFYGAAGLLALWCLFLLALRIKHGGF